MVMFIIFKLAVLILLSLVDATSPRNIKEQCFPDFLGHDELFGVVEQLSLREVLRLGSCSKRIQSLIFSSPERVYHIFVSNAEKLLDNPSNIVLSYILANNISDQSTYENDVTRFARVLHDPVRSNMMKLLLKNVSQIELDYISRIFVQQGLTEWFHFTLLRLSQKGAVSIWYDLSTNRRIYEKFASSYVHQIKQLLLNRFTSLETVNLMSINTEYQRFLSDIKELILTVNSESDFAAVLDKISIWPDFSTFNLNLWFNEDTNVHHLRFLLNYGYTLARFETTILDGRHTSGELLMITNIHYHRLNSVQLLLAYGYPINKIIRIQRRPALVIASTRGDLKIVSLLLQHGADINLFGPSGETPLCAASRNGHTHIVRFLLSRGALIQHDGYRHRQDPILCASETGHLDVIRVLYFRGANMEVRNYMGQTPMILACVYGYDDVLRFLISRKVNTSVYDSHGRTAFMYAAMNGHVTQMKMLVKISKTFVNQSDSKGWSSLMYASENDDEESVDYLLTLGADVRQKSYDGWTALLAAALTGNGQTVDKLILHGADPNSHASNGRTPLMAASEYGFYRVVKVLISHKANVNQCDEDGMTALMYAVIKGHYLIVKLLLKNGADVKLKAIRGNDVFRCARMFRRYEILKLLTTWRRPRLQPRS